MPPPNYPPRPGTGLGPGVISLMAPTSPPYPSSPGAFSPASRLGPNSSLTHRPPGYGSVRSFWPHSWSGHSFHQSPCLSPDPHPHALSLDPTPYSSFFVTLTLHCACSGLPTYLGVGCLPTSTRCLWSRACLVRYCLPSGRVYLAHRWCPIE